MNAPSPKWTRHWAAVPSGGQQSCAACGKLLVDQHSSVPRLRFFPSIAPVYERAAGPRRELVTAIAAEDTFRWCSTQPRERQPGEVACA